MAEPIIPHPPTGDFDTLVRKIILNYEGPHIDVPHNIGDNTLTYGYGFTFIRKADGGRRIGVRP
jgi:hypothetical protein